jgi:hypothetical protein
MNKSSKHTDESVTQSVANDFIRLQTAGEQIQIGFTDQKATAYAGLSAFIGFLHWHRLARLLSQWLPQGRSNNRYAAEDLALGFIVGILSGAKKLAQVAFLRRDVALAPLLQIKAIGSESTLSRFFRRFDGAGMNLRIFGRLWQWCMERLPSLAGGYTLDLDSTQLLHEDSLQAEGVRTGHTPRGLKRCLNPLLAFLAEPKLVAGFWLRPGNTVSFNNVIAFTLWVLQLLPRQVRIGLVRADSGFCFQAWLELLERQHLSYIVVGKLHEPVRNLLRKEQVWVQTEVEGTEVSQCVYQGPDWPQARRVVLIRHRDLPNKRSGGKTLLEVPGYRFQVLVTNLGWEVPPLQVWRRYNGRAGSENVIKELDQDFGLPQICLQKFWSTEAALGLTILAYNLCTLFQRHLSWMDKVTANTLRFRLFSTAGILSKTSGITTLRLAVPLHERDWWRGLFEKLISPFPNCNAVEPWPPPGPTRT